MSDSLDRRKALYGDRVAQLERAMEIRRVEELIEQLCVSGEVFGTTHLCIGQEAINVGIAAATLATDWITGTYRGHGLALGLGMTPKVVLGEVLGRTAGCVAGCGGSMHLVEREIGLLPTFAIVGAGLPVAAGTALSAQLLDEGRVAVAVFGDGATNIGAFHETLNLARIWQLPIVFACENNLYGEYSRIDITTPFEDLSRRASAYDIPAQIVDGQDVDAVVRAVTGAVVAARAGEGPQFLEFKTYRYRGHAYLDSASYRDSDEFEQWTSRDPITILQSRLVAAGGLTTEDSETMGNRLDDRIASAYQEAAASPEPDLAQMFQHVYATGN